MSTPFDRFNERIDAASDNRTRRALLAELGMWRAQHLTDIPAMREAAFAMSRLYAAVGDHEDAIREARSLVSLCKTAPKASGEERKHANGWLQSLGGATKKKKKGKKGRSSSSKKRQGPRPVERARDAARRGDWEGIIKALRGKRGAKAAISRTYSTLRQAMDKTGEARERALEALADTLRQRASLPSLDQKAVAEAEAAESEVEPTEPKVAESQLAKVLGVDALPRKRRALLELMDQWMADHPDQVDALAAAALEHHVATRGLKVPAPWLVSYVAHALATGPGARTRTELDRLRGLEAYAVTAYSEWPFNRAVEVLAEAARKGWEFADFRRGVLSRGEPRGRKLWTLRLVKDDVERMLVVGSASDEPYDKGLVTRLADRVIELNPRLALVAPGAGNAGLREALAERGVTTMEDDANATVLDALEQAEPVESSAPVPEHKKPHVALEELLKGDDLPEVEAMKPLIADMRRAFEAFRNAAPLMEEDDGDARLARLLAAAHQVAGEGRRLNEGTTLSIRAAAKWPDGEVASLVADGPHRERYGGPGYAGVIAIARAAQQAGWTVDRVLRGVTRRERRENPPLDPLSPKLRSLWRVVAEKGDDTMEIWFASELDPEARAGIPILLLQDRDRIVVWPIEAGLLEWYGTLDGPTAIGWVGPESASAVEDALREA